jgi:antitoxin CcdA
MKRAANLSIDEALLAEAKARGINLSEMLESALRQELRKAAAKKWLASNTRAIRSFNEQVMKEGTFGEQVLGDE